MGNNVISDSPPESELIVFQSVTLNYSCRCASSKQKARESEFFLVFHFRVSSCGVEGEKVVEMQKINTTLCMNVMADLRSEWFLNYHGQN